MATTRKPKATPAITVMPPHAASIEMTKFVPQQEFTQLSFWGKIKEKDQQVIIEESRQLMTAMVVHGSSELAIGQHLSNLREVLKGYYLKFLKKFTNINERSSYRYIAAYNNARERFPETVLKAAMARGMKILGHQDEKPLGKYTEVYQLLPPPRNPDPAQANRYLDQLEKTRKERVRAIVQSKGKKGSAVNVDAIKKDPQWLLMSRYRLVRNALQQLPAKQRRRWLDSFVGMILTDQGIGNPTSFSPEAIPEKFQQGPGRPHLVAEDMAESA